MSVGDQILKYCVSLDKDNDSVMTDCNKFVRKVAAKFSVTVTEGDADKIVGSFNSAPFTKTTADAATAMSWADSGLVVAGMTKAELNGYGPHSDGHVAIVHSDPTPGHLTFPLASWGSLGGRGKSKASIRISFPSHACDDGAVHFAFAPATATAADLPDA